jgi:hypothetical protein
MNDVELASIIPVERLLTVAEWNPAGAEARRLGAGGAIVGDGRILAITDSVEAAGRALALLRGKSLAEATEPVHSTKKERRLAEAFIASGLDRLRILPASLIPETIVPAARKRRSDPVARMDRVFPRRAGFLLRSRPEGAAPFADAWTIFVENGKWRIVGTDGDRKPSFAAPRRKSSSHELVEAKAWIDAFVAALLVDVELEFPAETEASVGLRLHKATGDDWRRLFASIEIGDEKRPGITLFLGAENPWRLAEAIRRARGIIGTLESELLSDDDPDAPLWEARLSGIGSAVMTATLAERPFEAKPGDARRRIFGKIVGTDGTTTIRTRSREDAVRIAGARFAMTLLLGNSKTIARRHADKASLVMMEEPKALLRSIEDQIERATRKNAKN